VKGSGLILSRPYYHSIWLEELRKAMNKLSQDRRSPGVNTGPSECEVEVLPIYSACLIESYSH
jgi:hypothetical protein